MCDESATIPLQKTSPGAGRAVIGITSICSTDGLDFSHWTSLHQKEHNPDFK
jgi:hypothetical protein